jgi:hypothetical protein
METVVYSASDDYSELFSTIQGEVGPGVHFGQEVRPDVLQRTLDKTGLPALAATSGVRVPRTVVNDAAAVRSLRVPLIVKPAVKRHPGLNVEAVAFRLRVCFTHADAEEAVERLVELGVGSSWRRSSVTERLLSIPSAWWQGTVSCSLRRRR